MTCRSRRAALLLGTSLAAVTLAAPQARAVGSGVTFYTDQTSFQSAAGPLLTFGFTGVVADNSATGAYANASGFTRDGVTFVGSNGNSGYYLGLQGPDFYSSADYNHGLDQPTLQGPAITSSYYNISNGATTISFSSPVTAFGLTVFDVEAGDSSGAGTDTVNLNAGGSTGSVVTPTTGAAFLGFVSSTAVSSITLTGTTAEEFPTLATIRVSSTATIATTGGDVAANVYSLGSLAAQTSPLTFNGGTLQLTGGSFAGNVVPSPVTLSSTNGTIDTSTGSGGFSGVVSGPGSLTITGGNTFTLSGSNTYTGGTVLTAGTLAVSSDSALGTGSLTVNGGTLQAAVGGNSVTIGNGIVIGSSGATFDSAGANSLNLTGALSGASAGTVTFTDSSSNATPDLFDFIVSGTNTTTAQVVVTATANLQTTSTDALGTGALEVDGRVGVSANTLHITTLTGTGNIRANGFDQGSNIPGSIVVENGNLSGKLNDATSYDSNGSYTGVLSLTKVSDGSASGGTLTLSGSSNFSGGTQLQAGTIAVGNNNALGTGPLVMAAGTTLQLATNGVTLPNAITLNGTDTIDTQAFSNGLGLTGVISGSGTLVKVGATGLGLDTANTYTGGTLLQAGHITLRNSTGLGTGTLTFAGGFLRAGVDGLTVGNAATLSANGSIDTQAFGLTYAGAIGGSGQLTKIGTGTLTLSASNTYSGGTLLSAGTLAVSSDGALGTGTLTLNGGALQVVSGTRPTLSNMVQLNTNSTIDTNGGGLVLSSTVTGSGSLTVMATGGTYNGNDYDSVSVGLTSTNTYTGGTSVLYGASIQVKADNALGSGAIQIEQGGIVDLAGFNQTATTLTGAGKLVGTGLRTGPQNSITNETFTVQSGNFTGTINSGDYFTTANGGTTVVNYGDITLVKTSDGTASGGTLTLSGDNTYGRRGGQTLLEGGTIAVGSATALGSSLLTMSSGTTLQLASGGVTLPNAITLTGTDTIDTQAFSNGLGLTGVISGSGTLVKIGSADLGLYAASTYTGGTELEAGRITLQNGAGLGTGTLTFAGGVLLAGVDGLTVGNAATLSAAGSIDTQAFGLTSAGVIGGSGQLTKLGTGTLTLTGANTFSGGTQLQAGTIAVGQNSALGTGPLAMSTGTTLQLASNGVTLPNAITLNGTDTVDTQNYSNGLGLAGVVSGSGTLVKIGAAELGLDVANTYTGGTLLQAGPLTLHDGAGLGTGALTFAGGFLRAGVDGLTVGNAATLSAAGSIDTQAFGLTYAGVIAGSGQLTKLGAGTLTLTGVNTYAGGTVLSAGTLALGNGAALGTGGVNFAGGVLQAGVDGLTIGNGATLSANGSIDTQAFGLTYAGVIAGSGQLTKFGTGTLTLTGANTYAGGTVLSAGTLALGSGAALGTGPITVAGGVLQAGADGLTVGNAVTLSANGTIDTQAFALTETGAIAGSGQLTKVGPGTLTLTGSSSYTGGTVLRAGTLAVGSGAALGAGTLTMDEGTTLRFAADGLTLPNAIAFTGLTDPTIDTGSGTETISGPITGGGSLTKVGTGTLDLTGTDTYTGATTVAQGTLLVDGSLTSSPVTVQSGASLGGTGSIASFTLQSGAVLAPTQALTITGNAIFATGSTYQVTLNPDGTTTRLAVGGTATLNGAALSVLASSGRFTPSTAYTILTAASGVSGTFGSLSAPATLALLAPTLTYGATDVVLTLRAVDFTTVATTPDQAATARAVQALGPSSPLYNAVIMQDQAGARQAFASSSGVTHASTTAVVQTNTRLTTGLLVDRLWDVSGSGLSAQQVLDQFAPNRLPSIARCYGEVVDPASVAPPRTYTAWGEAFGTFGHTDGGLNAGSLDRALGGFVLGVDTPLDGLFGKEWRGGVAGGYTDTSFQSHLDGGSGTVQGVFGSLYGGARYGAVDIRIGATAGGTFTNARRTVAFGGDFFETESSANDGVTVQTFGEVGYRVPLAQVVVEPVAGASFLHVHQDGFHETGGAAALTAAPLDSDLGTTTLGVRGEAQPFKGLPIVAHGLLAWQHVIGDVSPATTLAFEAAPANTFAVTGTPIDRDALAAEAAVDYRVSTAMDVGLSYVGQVGATAYDHSVKGRLEYRF